MIKLDFSNIETLLSESAIVKEMTEEFNKVIKNRRRLYNSRIHCVYFKYRFRYTSYYFIDYVVKLCIGYDNVTVCADEKKYCIEKPINEDEAKDIIKWLRKAEVDKLMNKKRINLITYKRKYKNKRKNTT